MPQKGAGRKYDVCLGKHVQELMIKQIQGKLIVIQYWRLSPVMQETWQPDHPPNSTQAYPSGGVQNSTRLNTPTDHHALTTPSKSAQELTEELSMEIQVGYYRTMEFVYKTWNYNTDIIIPNSHEDPQQEGIIRDEQERDDEVIELPEAQLVGNIHLLEDFKLRPGGLMKITFKSTYDNKQKHILMTDTEYKKNYVKNFNRMMKNKHKNEKYIFTHLHPVLYLRSPNEPTHQLYFLLQPFTQLIHITEQYYNSHLRPIERIIDQDFKYSNIKLSKIYSVEELDKNCKDGFMLAQIRQKFESREKQNLAIVGLISTIEQPQPDKNSRNKKQLVVWMTQTLYRTERPSTPHTGNNEVECSELGRCKLIIRYSPTDEGYIEALVRPNCTYFIADPEITVTENVNIIFSVNIGKNNAKNSCIFKISSEPYEGVNFGDITKKRNNPFALKEVQSIFGIKLQTIKINSLLEKCINRNIVKLQVGLLQVEVIYGSIRCPKCNIEIKRNTQLDRLAAQTTGDFMGMEDDEEMRSIYCRSQHKQSHCLQLWGTVRVADETGPCLVSLEHKEIIKFLQLEQYYEEIEKCIIENGKGMVVMSSNKNKTKQEQDVLFMMRNRVRKSYVEKVIVGYAKTELDKTFRESLSEEEQLEYQASFQNSKKYLQQKKIFPNGIIEKRSEEMLLLPFIKVMEVLDAQW